MEQLTLAPTGYAGQRVWRIRAWRREQKLFFAGVLELWRWRRWLSRRWRRWSRRRRRGTPLKRISQPYNFSILDYGEQRKCGGRKSSLDNPVGPISRK